MKIPNETIHRKNEILAIAERLFSVQGFDKTSINDILQEAKIARGTLYYYFESKEAIMDTLIEKLSQETFGAMSEVANDTTVPVIERILRVIMSMNLSDDSAVDIAQHLNRPQNALMHQKSQREIMKKAPPILSGIVQEGVDSGIFDTPFPLQSMEMIIASISALVDDAKADATEEERGKRLQALLYNIERMLGAKPNSFESAFKNLSALERSEETK